MPIRHRAWAALVSFVLLQGVFFGGLIAAQALPDGPIVDRLEEAVDNGTYGPSRMPDRMGGQGVTFTDCVLLGTGLNAEPGESLIHQAARMPRIGNCGAGEDHIRALAAGESVESGEYFRYWAGYVVLTRPVLALAGVDGLHMLVGALLATSVVVAWRSVALAVGGWTAAVVLAPLLLATNLTAMPVVGFSHALSTSVGLLGLAAVAVGARLGARHGLASVALAAAVYCYVDLLTNPPVWWLLSAFVFGATVWSRHRTASSAARAVVAAGVVWPVAFGATWASRWLIALLVLGPDHALGTILGKVSQRTGGEARGRAVDAGDGLRANWEYWWDTVPTSRWVLVLLLALVLGLLGVGLVRERGRGAAALALLAAPALVSIGWLLILNEHSAVHAHFTYRVIPAALAVVAASALTVWGPGSRPPSPGALQPGGGGGPRRVSR